MTPKNIFWGIIFLEIVQKIRRRTKEGTNKYRKSIKGLKRAIKIPAVKKKRKFYNRKINKFHSNQFKVYLN